MASGTDKLERIFAGALDHEAGVDRERFLGDACAGDLELLARARALIAAHDSAGAFLSREDEREGGGEATGEIGLTRVEEGLVSGLSEGPGTVIGRYKLLEQIGEGGFGVVYLAEQQEPVVRKVALKIIKPGMDTRQVIARFEAERQAVALMDHPNIAKVLDAGATDTGRPYFVMELVHGVPITRFCDEARLPTPERLELFREVCGAVQHAHQKGIIHRDLKPSNVLVALHGDQPVPKVIDFGIAKATQQRLTERTLFTHYSQFVGTPAYMSPEQASLNALDIDTRSDIYSLGVLLYELLTGQTPFDTKSLLSAGLEEIRRIIREEDPPKPSTRLSTFEDPESSKVAQCRRTDTKRLGVLVRGDLDWIVMKTLEKDRARRYETANALSQDIRRHLQNEPVSAAAPSMVYLLAKFARRQKAGLITAATLAAVLLAAAGFSMWQAVKASRAKERALTRTEQAQKSMAILFTIFADLDPIQEHRDGVPLRIILGERLLAAVNHVESDALGDPENVAHLKARLGKSLLSLGHPRVGAELLEESLRVLRARLGLNDSGTLLCMGWLVDAYTRDGRAERAIRLCQEVVQARPDAWATNQLDRLRWLETLGSAYRHSGQLTRALELWEDVLRQKQEALGSTHAAKAHTMSLLAGGYMAAHRPQDALDLWEEALAVDIQQRGPDHVNTLAIANNLAIAYGQMGDLEEARSRHEDVLGRRRAKFGPDHPDTLNSMGNLAACYWKLGRLDKSVPLFEEILELEKEKLGPNHPHTVITRANLGVNLRDAGRLEEAIPLLERVHRERPADSGLPWFGDDLAHAYLQLCRTNEAATLVPENLAYARAHLTPASRALADRLGLGGECLVRAGRPEEAEPYLRECLKIYQEASPANWRTSKAGMLLATILLDRSQDSMESDRVAAEEMLVEAERLLTAAQARLSMNGSSLPPNVDDALTEVASKLGQLYTLWGKTRDAEEWRAFTH